MKATEQHFSVVLLYKVILTFAQLDDEQHFLVVLFFIHDKVVLTSESVKRSYNGAMVL